MAELADALDSGSSECKFMQVQVLLSAPKTPVFLKRKAGVLFCMSLIDAPSTEETALFIFSTDSR